MRLVNLYYIIDGLETQVRVNWSFKPESELLACYYSIYLSRNLCVPVLDHLSYIYIISLRESLEIDSVALSYIRVSED